LTASLLSFIINVKVNAILKTGFVKVKPF